MARNYVKYWSTSDFKLIGGRMRIDGERILKCVAVLILIVALIAIGVGAYASTIDGSAIQFRTGVLLGMATVNCLNIILK